MDFFTGTSPVVVGHRGEPVAYPDNCLTGLLSGLDASGAVEVDVRLTADGRLVLSHDPELAGYPVGGTPWPVLAAVDLGGGHRPCLLDEAMAVPGRFDLEVKNLPGDQHFEPDGARLALMTAARARPSDIVTSFYWPDMDLVRQRAPDVVTGILVDENGPLTDALQHCQEMGHAVLAPHESLIDGDLVARASAENLRVIAWTVNEVARSRELAEIGVAAIITDDPQTISSGLREHRP